MIPVVLPVRIDGLHKGLLTVVDVKGKALLRVGLERGHKEKMVVLSPQYVSLLLNRRARRVPVMFGNKMVVLRSV